MLLDYRKKKKKKGTKNIRVINWKYCFVHSVVFTWFKEYVYFLIKSEVTEILFLLFNEWTVVE